MAVIDLYSGIGGWTLGFKMAGIPVLSSYEWWKDANNTHNKNFGSEHKERDIRKLVLKDMPDPSNVQFVVGSPPCTQFSLANRGGKGDIADGLIDIYKFLEVVEYMEPKYWAMENVPRVAGILENEIKEGGKLDRFKHLFKDIKVYNSSDFGVPQDRKRMIAGNFPFNRLESYSSITPRLTLGDVLKALESDPLIDPIYGIEIARDVLTDHIYESPLSAEEERMNSASKSHHAVYNKMSFPDRQERPSRTVTALCTRVSRESIIVQDSRNQLRRLTIRERGCLQSFPITYQFFSNTYAGKIKMIGNAVPPLLTFYIAQSMQEVAKEDLKLPHDVKERIVLSPEQAISHRPDLQGANYTWSRSFWLAINGLRFGSGVRFELKNYHDKKNKTTSWRVNFFYGNSKNIKGKTLDGDLFKRAFNVISLSSNNGFNVLFDQYISFVESIDERELQINWTNKDKSVIGPIFLLDKLAQFTQLLKEFFNKEFKDSSVISEFVLDELMNGDGKMDNKKLSDNSLDVFVGILIGSSFNSVMESRPIIVQDLELFE